MRLKISKTLDNPIKCTKGSRKKGIFLLARPLRGGGGVRPQWSDHLYVWKFRIGPLEPRVILLHLKIDFMSKLGSGFGHLYPDFFN